MMPINYILRKCTVDKNFIYSGDKVSNRRYIHEIKIFVKNEKEPRNTYTI